MANVRLQVDTESVIGGIDRVRAGINPPSQPLRQSLLAGALRWLTFLRERFNRASHGDGTWPDIKPSTKRARLRRVLGPGRRKAEIAAYLEGTFFEILKDKGTLYNSLAPGDANNVTHDRPMGIEIESTVPYARFHQQGDGRLPERAIIVEPDASTGREIRADLERGVGEVVRAAGLSNG